MIRVKADRIHHLRARPAGHFATKPEFDGFEGLNTDDSSGQAGVQFAVILGVRTKAHRAAGDDGFEHSAQSVASRLGSIDRGDNCQIGFRIHGVNRA